MLFSSFVPERWYHRPTTPAAALSHPTIAFSKDRLAKLGLTNRKIRFGGKFIVEEFHSVSLPENCSSR
jgi:hypothetical protein